MDKEDQILKVLNNIYNKLEEIAENTDRNTDYTYNCKNELEEIKATVDKLK